VRRRLPDSTHRWGMRDRDFPLSTPAPGEPVERTLLLELLKRRPELKGQRFALFFVTGEGRAHPFRGQEAEEASGYVLTGQDEVYYFWLGWDPARGEAALVRFERVSRSPAGRGRRHTRRRGRSWPARPRRRARRAVAARQA
jgi:hypothetical protein